MTDIHSVAFLSDIKTCSFSDDRLHLAVCDHTQVIVFRVLDGPRYVPTLKTSLQNLLHLHWETNCKLEASFSDGRQSQQWDVAYNDNSRQKYHEKEFSIFIGCIYNERLRQDKIRLENGISFANIVLKDAADFQELESSRDSIKNSYRSLPLMKPGHSPAEANYKFGNRDDLVRLYTQMRTWAKKACISDTSCLQNPQLVGALSAVVRLDNNELPNGLPTDRVTHLFLHALVAHHLYTSVICNPFLFEESFEDNGIEPSRERVLQQVYKSMQSCDEKEAHIWRSQTLRLLQPPVRGDRPLEDALRNKTDCQIASAALLQAKSFLSGPARHIIQNKVNFESALGQQLVSIYQEAANTSYKLWIQRATFKCTTLLDLPPLFNAENECLKPHSLVHPDDHEDRLLGRPITVVVQPLLQAYGYNDAECYDDASVLAPAVVWFDSKKEG